MEKEKVLYIMGIDWNWIYQRPQLIAEMLSNDFDVTVIFPRSIVKYRKTVDRIGTFSDMRILWTIPFQEKISILGCLAEGFQQRLFCDYQKYDYIFIGYPLYARYIPDDYGGRIFYDCMDNHEALYPDHKRVEHILKEELRLAKKCAGLLVSSKLLQEKMNLLCGEDKAVLVRNGVQMLQTFPVKRPNKKTEYEIGYVGTISEWFDWELIQKSLVKNAGLRYYLIGPGGDKAEQISEQIIWKGIVPHNELWKSVEDFDCLIMPFILNDIILSVDPVKLYEYIAFGKCVVSIYYPELEHFRDYVYFYHTPEEYDELINELCEKGFPAKYDGDMQKEFIGKNSWDARYHDIRKEMYRKK